MKKNLPDITRKLKIYSSLTAVVCIASDVSGQIVYKDIDPDFILDSNTDAQSIDMDDDGDDDFIIYMNTNTNPGVFVWISPFGNVGSIAGSAVLSSLSANTYFYPHVLEEGDEITDALTWNSFNGGAFQTFASASFYSTGPYGQWFDVVDGYVGLRTISGSDNYYGWLRMSASADGFTFIVKDFAYNSIINEKICAGDKTGAPDCLNEITPPVFASVSDVGDNFNGLDLGFVFNGSPSEAGIVEYRVISVKSENATAFAADISIAEGMALDQYI
ncbi:MAG: hypothetical protein H7X71_07405, partial [Chitinophagales bacterium]|nr:hypothetical protein [Chitinophagales bacterium]